jgi:hypothetical protein
MEPIIQSFEKEADKIIILSQKLSHYEKVDFVRRSHYCKEYMAIF